MASHRRQPALDRVDKLISKVSNSPMPDYETMRVRDLAEILDKVTPGDYLLHHSCAMSAPSAEIENLNNENTIQTFPPSPNEPFVEDVLQRIKLEAEMENMQAQAFQEVNIGEADEDIRAGEGELHVNGKLFSKHEYFGKDMATMIKELDDIGRKEQEPLPFLATELMQHQATGIAKMEYICAGPFQGAILGDEMGLGKTLQIIALILKERNGRRGNFALVITTKTCVDQWVAEIRSHIRPEYRQKVVKLEDPSWTADKLIELGPDFVITTRGFVSSQYKKWELHEKFVRAAERHQGEGRAAAIKKFKKDERDLAPIALSLFSPLYAYKKMEMDFLVVDEAHCLKNMDSVCSEAVFNLRRKKTILATGTPIKNKPIDIAGLLRQISNHPFVELPVFKKIFLKDVSQRARSAEFAYLVRFLQCLFVARPASILELPGVHEHIEPFVHTPAEEDLITYWVVKFLYAVKKLKGESDDGQTADVGALESKKVLALMQRAQFASANHKCVMDKRVSNDIIKEMRKLCPRLAKAFRKSQLGKSAPRDNSDLEKLGRHFDAYMEYIHTSHNLMRKLLKNRKMKKRSVVRSRIVKKQIFDEQQRAGGTPRLRAAWLEKVRKATDDDLGSSRVNCITSLVSRITRDHPGEGIIIFSKYLTFLDIVAEAIERSDPQFEVLRFNGTLSSSDRLIARHQFTSSNSPKKVILITADAGGAGMNLTAASVVIQAEPWWVRADEDQALCRALRKGQTKEVHHYRIEGVNSLADRVVKATRDNKVVLLEEYYEKLRKEDEQPVDIPLVFPVF